MLVWVQNPFDSLPCEGARKMRFWLLCEAFARAGHRAVLWTSDFSHATKAKRRFAGPVASEAFEVRLIPTRPYRRNVGWARVWSHFSYARAWKRLATAADVEKPDLIVSSVPTLSAAGAALALGQRFGAKVVLDVMDAWPETFERLVPAGLRGLAHLAVTPLRRKARRLYRAADVVTGVSARYRALTGRDDYFLAYHGIDCARATPSPVPRAAGRIRLVYAGNLGRTYDLATVVAAVRAHPEMELDVAGFGSFNCDCPRVRVHGLLSESDLQRLLATADVGVVPMSADSWVGVPYKFCDYARAGLPIVSSLGGETADLLAQYACGACYRVGDVASFSEAVRQAVAGGRGASRRMCDDRFDATRIYDGYVRRVLASDSPYSARRS